GGPIRRRVYGCSRKRGFPGSSPAITLREVTMSTKATHPAQEATPDSARVQLAVGGMTCAACQSAVQRALERTPGVTKATVSLMTHRAEVQYIPTEVSPESLAETVRNTGYDA